MNHPTFEPLRLELQLPARWEVGGTGLVRLRLHNLGQADFLDVQWHPCWTERRVGEEQWRQIGTLKRQSSLALEARLPAPPAAGADVFQICLRLRLGQLQDLELWSDKVEVLCRPRPQAGASQQVVLNESGIQGDKIGWGQQVSEPGSGNIGHQIHFHGSSHPEQEHQQWLEAGNASQEMRPVPLYVAEEVCHDWTNALGLPLVGLRAGFFPMGSSPGDAEAQPDEKPCREVHLTRSFWAGRFPVTNAQWLAVMGEPGPVTKAEHRADTMPVSNLSWGQAVDFCAKLTQMEMAQGTLPPGFVYRLPTEAEWEYLCRAETDTARYGPLKEIALCAANGRQQPLFTGNFKPNAWGLHDTLGLVFEWCLDAYAPYHPMHTTDPVCWSITDGQPLKRVIRGGCYQGPDVFARASARAAAEPLRASHRVGFRVVLAREQ